MNQLTEIQIEDGPTVKVQHLKVRHDNALSLSINSSMVLISANDLLYY